MLRKEVFDRLAAGILLIVLTPVLLAIAFGVKLSSLGPVLFSQQRVGKDGEPFELLKFRSMREEHTGAFQVAPGLAPGGVEGEDRRTPFGAWLRRHGLDELPQLVNVLLGDMSLVGPRPERPQYHRHFCARNWHFADRTAFKPGITGLAQVSGLRGQTCVDRRLIYDLEYINHWNFRSDLGILAMTPAAAWAGGDTL